MKNEETKKRHCLRLRTPTEVRRSLNRIANLTLNKDIDPNTANALNGLCKTILDAIRTDEYENKIKDLENQLEEILDETH